jgi:hypothetical protein
MTINEGSQNTGALVAVGLGLVGGPALKVQADRGEQKRQSIGEVVPGIRQQGEAMSSKPREDLDGRKRKRRDQREAEHPTCAAGMVMMSHVLKRLQLVDKRRQRFDPLLPTLR